MDHRSALESMSRYGFRWPVFGAIVVVAVAAAGALTVVALSRVGNARGYAPAQPIDFSHRLHAGEYQIACLYCHYGAERSRHAGIPALSVCLNCHESLQVQSAEVAKLKEAFAQNRPVEWIQVHRLPDFTYFNHSQHLSGGVACQDCHGPVETMDRLRQEAPLTMGWCIDCHRSRGISEFTAPAEPAGLPSGGQDCAKCHY